MFCPRLFLSLSLASGWWIFTLLTKSSQKQSWSQLVSRSSREELGFTVRTKRETRIIRGESIQLQLIIVPLNQNKYRPEPSAEAWPKCLEVRSSPLCSTKGRAGNSPSKQHMIVLCESWPPTSFSSEPFTYLDVPTDHQPDYNMFVLHKLSMLYAVISLLFALSVFSTWSYIIILFPPHWLMFFYLENHNLKEFYLYFVQISAEFY